MKWKSSVEVYLKLVYEHLSPVRLKELEVTKRNFRLRKGISFWNLSFRIQSTITKHFKTKSKSRYKSLCYWQSACLGIEPMIKSLRNENIHFSHIRLGVSAISLIWHCWTRTTLPPIPSITTYSSGQIYLVRTTCWNSRALN